MSKQQTKEQLINQLIGLINGSVSKDDLKPKDLCICIGYGSDNVYLINNHPASKEEYEKVSTAHPVESFTVTYGEYEQTAADTTDY
ncbi:hypothetical protein ACTHQF_06625 [Pedobacter sp. SAFR-022]|uniref:hypothetical protein n=1 Tax=Pedobacter sp. SAFR-022 TaxID=3436861 RepID=UPI003F7EFDC6